MSDAHLGRPAARAGPHPDRLSVLGALARRFALTPVPLYLLTGLALGEGGIAPVRAAGEFVQIAGAIGVVLCY